MRWPAKHLQELQPIIYGIAWAPMLQCGRSQTFFVLAKSVGSLSVNRIIRSKVAASDLVRSTEVCALAGYARQPFRRMFSHRVVDRRARYTRCDEEECARIAKRRAFRAHGFCCAAYVGLLREPAERRCPHSRQLSEG